MEWYYILLIIVGALQLLGIVDVLGMLGLGNGGLLGAGNGTNGTA